MGRSGKLFLLSAPSGCGKTTVTNRLLELIGSRYDIARVITYTSRQPRPHDKPGIDYHFISVADFERKIEEKFFLEWSSVYKDYYGTPGDMLERIESGSSYIAIVDRLGVSSILKNYQDAVTIWLQPPSLKILEERLRFRQSETEEQIQKRLSIAQQEMTESQKLSYQYHVLNNLFETTVDELRIIIQKELSKNCK